MRRDELEHLIRATTAILGVDEVIIIGSQAILGSFTEDELPAEAIMSVEADVVPLDDEDGSKAELLTGSIGEGSLFDESFAVHADGVSTSTAVLPEGWGERLVPLVNANTSGATGWCLEPHDLVVAKLVAGREKDIVYIRALVGQGIVDPALVVERLGQTAIEPERRDRARAQVLSFSPPAQAI